ncbi:NAD(P)H-quinone oxidoreductase subunit S, chloroplastic [Neltuma alba]|uniref:NAD(P)H-quinone oxidoreductase subunit S, chloroplastic n=1 Tax=Neltuma alba TaxID=207710 RepID=UPI0010A543BF|nr:NAD(P)H-quinone oxidoreductase subunit S, chloroplastic [Prosopis alba]
MAASLTLHSLNGSLLRSQFLGQDHKKQFTFHRRPTPSTVQTRAKFNLTEMLGGRGLCNGEKGIEKELKKQVEGQAPAASRSEQEDLGGSAQSTDVPEDAFEKEMMGLTGGFPGGEKGLEKFIQENPPPPKQSPTGKITDLTPSKKPKAPELPLLLPGMIAIVKNENNPFYMYCGIVQRITDGKAGVLFEGGNWDRLITFRLEELERREKGPPMKNPKSAVLEPFLEKKKSE